MQSQNINQFSNRRGLLEATEREDTQAQGTRYFVNLLLKFGCLLLIFFGSFMLDLEILHILEQFHALFLHLVPKSVPIVLFRLELLLVHLRHVGATATVDAFDEVLWQFTTHHQHTQDLFKTIIADVLE